ncbi:hypothetical protein NDU88_004628 [Pleurodeles waltl]|uniref:Uncharacterized protein n=1 Tax=Pleurodeles waltl TaxID=8319 RepID=A0AAV7UHL7_PLEWA|nr:hypothetical protein NDU88_004628 [Pleurodeles waltl]
MGICSNLGLDRIRLISLLRVLGYFLVVTVLIVADLLEKRDEKELKYVYNFIEGFPAYERQSKMLPVVHISSITLKDPVQIPAKEQCLIRGNVNPKVLKPVCSHFRAPHIVLGSPIGQRECH